MLRVGVGWIPADTAAGIVPSTAPGTSGLTGHTDRSTGRRLRVEFLHDIYRGLVGRTLKEAIQ